MPPASAGGGILQFSIPRAQLSDWPWDIELLQDGSPVCPTGESYILQRRPFTIRLRLPKPATVRLNTLDSDANFKKVRPGLRVEADKSFTPKPGGLSPGHCFSAGTGVVDADYHRTRLVVSESGHQEIYFTSYLDHRWSKVDVTEQRAVFERKVQHISLTAQGYDEPVDRTRCGQLYLLFLVKHHNDPEVHEDELRKLVLTFQ
jgi:hypothetical protein